MALILLDSLNFIYKTIPINDLNANPINPVMSIVKPSPRKPSGTLEYFSFSLIAANAIMAKKNPEPEPKP